MVRGSSPSRGRARIAAWAAVAVLMTGSAAACGDDSGGGGDSPPPTPSKEQTTSAPAPDPTSSAPAAGGAPKDAAKAEKEIKKNWEDFFDPKVKLKDKPALLENGDKMSEVIEGFSGDERGQQVTAEVVDVEFTSPEEAKITYALALKGATVLPKADGVAVLQDGTWKVSVKTLCGLIAMSGDTSPGPGCST
ncbi:hypothetical protein P8605_41415 [Streptomyces sp. T-3]|nr:hypothetical protein [Streptomyces sp. T-3]